MTLNAMARDCHALAVSKGWYDTEPGFPEGIANMHAELSEALEAYRKPVVTGIGSFWHTPDGKPEGVPIELADLLIRVFDLCGFYGIDIDRALRLKMEYNTGRPYRHGGKVC